MCNARFGPFTSAPIYTLVKIFVIGNVALECMRKRGDHVNLRIVKDVLVRQVCTAHAFEAFSISTSS